VDNPSVEEGVGGNKRRDKGLHAATIFAIRSMSSLQDWSVVNCLIAAHPKTEGVPDENLLNALASGQFANHLKSTIHRAIQFRVATVDNLPR
jgi:hypothetical protein